MRSVSDRQLDSHLAGAIALSLLLHLLALAIPREAPSRNSGRLDIYGTWLPHRPTDSRMTVDFREARQVLSYDPAQVAGESVPDFPRISVPGPGTPASLPKAQEAAPASASPTPRPGGGNDCWVAGFRFCSS
jgi:hypothetical protein